MRVYADNAATTPMGQAALDAMIPALKEEYGNPSSLHSVGQHAAEVLQKAREDIAKVLNASPKEIYFTSGGSEADNHAIYTAAAIGKKRGRKHMITSAFEHHAVLHMMKKMEREGFEVTYLPVHEDGLIRVDELKEAIRPDTVFVSIMYANNEIGTIQPIREIGQVCREAGVLFHTDAVQAAGHLPIDVEADQIDFLSLSAHKFHGPKGVGVLYANKRIRLRSLIEGGAQERGKRAGTENLPAIVGMAAALKDAAEKMEENRIYVTAMRDRLVEGIMQIPHTKYNGDPVKRLPGNTNFCFEGIEGESLLLLLDAKGIEGSSGSACTSGSLDPSHVLLAIGLPHGVAHGSLRLSLSELNTPEEVEYIITELPKVVSLLRSMSPVWDEMERGEREHVI